MHACSGCTISNLQLSACHVSISSFLCGIMCSFRRSRMRLKSTAQLGAALARRREWEISILMWSLFWRTIKQDLLRFRTFLRVIYPYWALSLSILYIKELLSINALHNVFALCKRTWWQILRIAFCHSIFSMIYLCYSKELIKNVTYENCSKLQ